MHLVTLVVRNEIAVRHSGFVLFARYSILATSEWNFILLSSVTGGLSRISNSPSVAGVLATPDVAVPVTYRTV